MFWWAGYEKVGLAEELLLLWIGAAFLEHPQGMNESADELNL